MSMYPCSISSEYNRPCTEDALLPALREVRFLGPMPDEDLRLLADRIAREVSPAIGAAPYPERIDDIFAWMKSSCRIYFFSQLVCIVPDPGTLISSGTFKTVFEGLLPLGETPDRVAMVATKKLRFAGQMADWNKNEVKYLRKLAEKPMRGLPRVLAVKEAPFREGYLGGFVSVQHKYDEDLHDLIRHMEERPIPEFQKRNLQYQIVQNIYGLHRKRIVHRDLKSENLFIQIKSLYPSDPLINQMMDPNTEISVVLGDFACATREGEPMYNEFCGTVEFAAPEFKDHVNSMRIGSWNQKLKEITTTALDIWAVGMVFLEIEGRTALFERMSQISAKGSQRPADLSAFTDPILRLIGQMLQLDPAKRISAENALPQIATIEMASRDRDVNTAPLSNSF